MNTLAKDKQATIIRAHVEGNSIRSMERMTGVHRDTIILKAAVALHFAHYNFVRIHQTLRVTPAMEAGIADHVWSIEEIAALLDSKTLTAVA